MSERNIRIILRITLLSIVLIFYSLFIVEGFKHHEKYYTENIYNCKIISKWQDGSSFWFAVVLKDGRNHKLTVTPSTYKDNNEGETVNFSLTEFDIESRGEIILFDILYFLSWIILIVGIMYFVILYSSKFFKWLFKKETRENILKEKERILKEKEKTLKEREKNILKKEKTIQDGKLSIINNGNLSIVKNDI